MDKMIKLLNILVLLLSFFGFFLMSKQDKSPRDILSLTETLEKDFNREFTRYAKTGEVSKQLEAIYDVLRLPDEVRYTEMSELPEPISIATCLTCRATVGTFINYRRKDNKTIEEISNLAYELCTRLNLQTSYVCRNMIDQMAPIMMYLIDNYPEVGSYDACAVYAQSDGCGPPKHEMFQLEVDVSNGGHEITGHKKATPSSGKFYKIVHLGDIHYDPDYVVSGNAKCKEPTCCRFNQGAPESPEAAAGRWGDYRSCDMPLETIVNAFQTIKMLHADVDHIYFSGDIIDHGVWETSSNGNIMKIETIMQLLKSEFPGVSVYPAMGNHEAHPVNMFTPSKITEKEFSMKYLYDYATLAWSHWIPKENLATVKDGGYYTTLIAPNYRLIVLNNNDAYTDNFWLLSGADTLKEQLVWLHDTLLLAEKNDEKVHIMRHIPGGKGSCFRYWSREYSKIVQRFHHVITAQFEGHTHKNQFELFYDTKNASYAINPVFNGGSLTTYSNLNPNFMVLYVDKESLEVIDFESYMFNLTDANLHPYQNPTWFKSYSFKDYWGLNDLSPESLDGLVERLASDEQEGYKYWIQKYKQGDNYIGRECDAKCQKGHICQIVTNDFEDDRRCKALYGEK